MKVISFRREDETESVGVLREDIGGCFDLIRALEIYATAKDLCIPVVVDMLDLLDTGLLDAELIKEVEVFIENHNLLEDLKETNYTILAPLARPRMIYALGRNYPAHAKESGDNVPDEPIIFSKAVTSVIGPEDEVVYKKWLTRVDPEAELAVIIDSGCNVKP